VCHRVQEGVYLKAWSGVCLRLLCELTWEHIVMQTGRVPLGAIESVLDSMPRSALGSILRAELGA